MCSSLGSPSLQPSETKLWWSYINDSQCEGIGGLVKDATSSIVASFPKPTSSANYNELQVKALPWGYKPLPSVDYFSTIIKGDSRSAIS